MIQSLYVNFLDSVDELNRDSVFFLYLKKMDIWAIALLVWIVIYLCAKQFYSLEHRVFREYAQKVNAVIHKRIPGMHIRFFINGESDHYLGCAINKDHVYITPPPPQIRHSRTALINYYEPIFLHEAAHVLCKSDGHTAEFYTILNELYDNVNPSKKDAIIKK